jgi:hypothetical protein
LLYKIGDANGTKTLEPLEFLDFADLGNLEKDLEVLVANNLIDILFEDARLMPVFKERPLQAEADLYALDRAGDLIIFELKNIKKRSHWKERSLHLISIFVSDL